MRKLPFLRTPVLFGLICLLTLTRCTQVFQPPQEFLGSISDHQKINLKIGLLINSDLREAQWQKRQSNGDKWVIPIGEWLCRNSEILARDAFSEVVVFNEIAKSQLAGIDAILMPKLVFMNRTMGATPFGESIIAIKVEWNLSTPNGKPIWIETTGGKANGPSKYSYIEIELRQALADLLLNSQQAIAASEPIKRYARELPYSERKLN